MPESFITALIGGLCIGVSAVLMMVLLGRIAGISGIVFNTVRSPVDNLWGLVFMIVTKSGQVHRMVNKTDQVVEAIWLWWAPGGDRSVFSGTYEFTEPAPASPNGQGFGDGETERLY